MSVVIDRHRVLAALLILLVGCPPPTTNTPSSAPAAAPVSSQAYFIRLASLTMESPLRSKATSPSFFG